MADISSNNAQMFNLHSGYSNVRRVEAQWVAEEPRLWFWHQLGLVKTSILNVSAS